MIERLNFAEQGPYSATEASIHLNRYALAKNLCNGKKVLDVACGEGYGSFLLAKWGASSVDAVDIDAPSIEKASQHFKDERIHFLCHTAEELPFDSHSFDIVTSFETIEHLDHPELFLQEIKRVLRPDGIILLSCPNDPYYYKEGTPDNPFHKRKYTYFDFKELTEKYLGEQVKYYLAFALNGFLNMPISRSTQPESASILNMMDMLNYAECSSALWVPQERYMNHWNSNYYVGIWGSCPKDLDVTTVVSPRDFFLPVTDEDIIFKKEVTQLKENYDEQGAQLRELMASAELQKQQLKIKALEQQRVVAMLDISNKEKTLLQEQSHLFVQQHEACRIQMEAYYNEICTMKSTKGYKLLNLVYRIRCKLRNLIKKVN